MSSTMLHVFLALSSLDIFFMSPHCLKKNLNHVPSSVFPTLVTCPLCHSTLPNTLGVHWHLFDIPLSPKNKNTNTNKNIILMSLDIFLMLLDTPQCSHCPYYHLMSSYYHVIFIITYYPPIIHDIPWACPHHPLNLNKTSPNLKNYVELNNAKNALFKMSLRSHGHPPKKDIKNYVELNLKFDWIHIQWKRHEIQINAQGIENILQVTSIMHDYSVEKT